MFNYKRNDRCFVLCYTNDREDISATPLEIIVPGLHMIS